MRDNALQTEVLNVQDFVKLLYDYEGEISNWIVTFLRPCLLEELKIINFLCHVPTLKMREYYFKRLFEDWDKIHQAFDSYKFFYLTANIVVPPWDEEKKPALLEDTEQANLNEEIDNVHESLQSKLLKLNLLTVINHKGPFSKDQISSVLDGYLKDGSNLALFLCRIPSELQRSYLYEYFNSSSSTLIIKLSLNIANAVVPPESQIEDIDELDIISQKIDSRYAYEIMMPTEVSNIKKFLNRKANSDITFITSLICAIQCPIKFFKDINQKGDLTKDNNPHLPIEIWSMVADHLIKQSHEDFEIQMILPDITLMLKNLCSLWPKRNNNQERGS